MKKYLPYRDTSRRDRLMARGVVHSRWLISIGSLLLGVSGLMIVSAYAAAPLSDDELDSKYLDVPVKSPYISKAVFDKANAHQSIESQPGITTLDGTTALVFSNTVETPLLAGIDQNTRLLGNADQLGVSSGVSSLAIPLAFGSENFSYKWAGNLDQVFTPSVEASRLLQYVYNTNGAEIYYTPLYRTGSTESFVHSDSAAQN